MVEYRLGRHDDAAHWLTNPAGDKEMPPRQAAALCFLAMAEHHRGRRDQARSALQRATELIASAGPSGDDWKDFQDWIPAIEAQRQAQGLLGVWPATLRPTTLPTAR
jgi:hypothetical protein